MMKLEPCTLGSFLLHEISEKDAKVTPKANHI